MPVSATKLKNEIERILAKLPNIGKIAINAPLKEQVLLTYMSSIKDELRKILAPSSLDSLTLYNDLLKFFKKNWQRTQGSLLSYTALPAAKVTQCLYALACLAAAYYNDHLKTEEELPTFGAALLFPDVDLDSYSQTRSIPLSIIHPIPFWNSNKKRELSFLSCLIYFSNYPKEEEQMVFSAEEEREVAEIDILHFQLRQAKEKDLAQKKEQLQLKTGQLSTELQGKIKHRNNLRRQKVLQLNKEAYQNYQFWKEQGKLQEQEGCLVPTLLPQDFLPKYILSEDKQYLLPVSLLLDEVSFQGLTLSEQQRLMKHSPETEAYGNALERLKWIESDQSHLLGQLSFLCRQLRAYDAHEGIGTAENAGSGAYQPIINFFAWYDLLRKEEIAKIPVPLKEQIELLGRLSSDPKLNKNATEQVETCIGTRREALQKAMKGLEQQLIQIACQGSSRERALKAAQDEVMKAKMALVQKLEQADYQGQDAWPLTKKILEAFSVKLSINTLADLNDFMRLEAEEIQDIGSKPGGNQAFANLLNSLEDLVVFIHEQPLKKLEAFLHISSPHLWRRFCRSVNDAGAILSSLEEEKLLCVFKDIYHKTDINSELFDLFVEEPAQLALLLESYSEGQRLQIVEQKDEFDVTLLHCAARNLQSLKLFLELYPSDQHFNLVKKPDKLGNTLLHYAAQNPESLRLILALYPAEQRFGAVKEKGYFSKSLLHYAAKNPESLRLILSFYPPEQRLGALKEEDEAKRGVFHLAASDPESLKIIFENLPEEPSCLEALTAEDTLNNTVLHFAATNPESLRLILARYPSEQGLEVLKAKNKEGNIVLHFAATNPESLRLILARYSPVQGLESLKAKNNEGNTVLHFAATYPESLRMILALYPEQRLEVLKEVDNDERTVLHLTAAKPELFKPIFESLREEQNYIELLTAKDNLGNTALHYAATNPSALGQILVLYPPEQRLEALQAKANDGTTVLHRAASLPETLKIALKSLPNEESRLLALKTKDNKDADPILHKIACKPDFLNAILDSFLEDESWLKVLKEKDKYGCTVLHHLAVFRPTLYELLKTIFERMQKGSILKIVKERSFSNNTVLHQAASNPDVLKVILTLYDEEQSCLADINAKGESGCTVLHFAARNRESLNTLLAFYPNEQSCFAAIQVEDNDKGTVLHRAAMYPQSLNLILKRLSGLCFEAVKAQDKEGFTVLHRAASRPESLKFILESLLPQQLFDALQIKNNNGNTALHRAVFEPKSLQMILEKLPEKLRLEVVNTRDSEGRTLLHQAAGLADSLKVILESLPLEQRSEAVKEKDKEGKTLFYKANLRLVTDRLPKKSSGAKSDNPTRKAGVQGTGMSFFDKRSDSGQGWPDTNRENRANINF